jgi:hypothetical protein
MRRFAPIVPVLALLWLTASAGAARHPAQAVSCAVRPSRVIVADAQAEVYRVPDGLGHLVVYACAYGHRLSRLGFSPDCGASSSGCAGVEHPVLTGPVVAYESFSIIEQRFPPGEGKRTFLVVVRDLRSGRVLRQVPTGSSTKPARVGIGPVSALVLKSDGAVGWIAANEAGASSGKYEVHAADATGARLLASGPGIEPGSLALGGSTLFWARSGQAASSLLN